jgi:hypothetical protein
MDLPMKKRRNRERAIPKKDTSKAGLNLVAAAILMIYIFGAVFLDILFPTEFNAEFYYAFKYVSLPAVALAYLLLILYQAINDVEFGFGEGLFYTGAFWLMLTLCAGGYVAAFNASIGEQAVSPIEGKVVGKFKTTGRYHVPYAEVLDPEIGRAVTIRLSKQEYETVSEGNMYRTEMMRGSLGLYYKKPQEKL